ALVFAERDESVLFGARALARASHPVLCRIHRIRDAVQRPYVVSEFVRGEALGAVGAPLPDRRVLEIGVAVAGALSGLHSAKIATRATSSSGATAPRASSAFGARARTPTPRR